MEGICKAYLNLDIFLHSDYDELHSVKNEKNGQIIIKKHHSALPKTDFLALKLPKCSNWCGHTLAQSILT